VPWWKEMETSNTMLVVFEAWLAGVKKRLPKVRWDAFGQHCK
jgi:hypothetical protein